MEEEEEKDQTTAESEAKPQPTILYCAVCGLPPEYCEFGPNFEKCKPWILEHCPEVYPNLLNLKDDEGGEKAEGEKEKSGSGKRGGKGLQKPKDDSEVKILPGGKVKKKEVPKVHISRAQRSKNKYTTVITGLDKFGIKLQEASKSFAKTFSCGSSVVKGVSGDEILIQGDFVDDLVNLLMEKHQIPEDSITIEDEKKKGRK
jgi:density-regulated protein DRP1